MFFHFYFFLTLIPINLTGIFADKECDSQENKDIILSTTSGQLKGSCQFISINEARNQERSRNGKVKNT